MTAIHEYESKNNWRKDHFARQYKMCTADGCKHFNFFDLKSIMMYGSKLPGTNITVIKPKTLCNGKECVIGQREELSFLDRQDITSAYNCSKLYLQDIFPIPRMIFYLALIFSVLFTVNAFMLHL